MIDKEDINTDAFTCASCKYEMYDDDGYEDAEGNTLCGECWNINTFLCYMCECVENVEYSEDVGSLFIIVNDEWINIPPGVYEVTREPHFWSEIAGKTYFYEDSVKRITTKTYDLTGHAWQCGGPLCRICSDMVKKDIVNKNEINQ